MPIVDGKTLIGWGAVRDVPWHFAGLFASQKEAQLKAGEMGDGYVARYGERQETSDTFTSEPPKKFSAIAKALFKPPPTAANHGSRLEAVATWINTRIARLRGTERS